MRDFIERIKYNPLVQKIAGNPFFVPAILLLILASLFLVSCGEADGPPEEAGIGTFSEGYRIGYLSKFSIKGNRLVGVSGEGEMFVGNESTEVKIAYSCGTDNKDTCYKLYNPWQFSATTTYSNFLTGFQGEYVVVRYRQVHVADLAMNTDYVAMDAFAPMDKEALSRKSCTSPDYDAMVNDSTKWSQGTRSGRLVKISWKGTLEKSYEATMQEGPSGGKFKPMSILDGGEPRMKDYLNCLHEIMFTGAEVNVVYAEDLFFNPVERDTAYTILKVTIKEKKTLGG